MKLLTESYCNTVKIIILQKQKLYGMEFICSWKNKTTVAPTKATTVVYRRGTSSKNIIAFRGVPYNHKMKVRNRNAKFTSN